MESYDLYYNDIPYSKLPNEARNKLEEALKQKRVIFWSKKKRSWTEKVSHGWFDRVIYRISPNSHGLPMEKLVMKASNKSWQFEVRSDFDIDWSLVFSELSKKNPVALIESGDTYYAAIHLTLLLKHEAHTQAYGYDPKRQRLARPKEMRYDDLHSHAYTIPGAVYSLQSKEDFSTVIEWAKSIRQTKWPKNYRKVAIASVTLPKI